MLNDGRHPARIWATVNGASTRLPDGGRQLIGGWSEDKDRPGAAEYVLVVATEPRGSESGHVNFLRNWARDIRQSSGASVDADRLDAIATELERFRLTASMPEDVKELVERLGAIARYLGGAPGHDDEIATVSEAATALASLSAKVEELTRERNNLQARLTARAKSMLRLREKLAEAHDGIEDEGDRVYFGSTNDADKFREVWRDLDAWIWGDIISDGKLTDIYEISRKAITRAEAAEASLAERDRIIAEKDKALDMIASGEVDRRVSTFREAINVVRDFARAARDRRAS